MLNGVCKGLDFNSLMIGLLCLSVDLIYSVAFLSTKEIGKHTSQNENSCWRCAQHRISLMCILIKNIRDEVSAKGDRMIM